MLAENPYKNPFLEKNTTDFLSCLEEKGDLSTPTSKAIKTHIDLITYDYTISSCEIDWINEIIMLFIGAIAGALISRLSSSSFKLSSFDLICSAIIIIFIYIRAKRR